MADNFYAWTTIRYGAKVEPKTGAILEYEEAKPGDTVTATQLFPNQKGDRVQAEFDALCLSGAVRPVPFPEDYPLDSVASVRDFLLDKALKTEGWEVNFAPGSYSAHDDTVNFNAVEMEGQAIREAQAASEAEAAAAEAAPAPTTTEAVAPATAS